MVNSRAREVIARVCNLGVDHEEKYHDQSLHLVSQTSRLSDEKFACEKWEKKMSFSARYFFGVQHSWVPRYIPTVARK